MMTKWIEFNVQAESVADFKVSLATLEIASKAEKGCANYSAYQSADNATVFTVLESWETNDDFENHRVAAHTSQFKKDCGSMIISKKGISLNPI